MFYFYFFLFFFVNWQVMTDSMFYVTLWIVYFLLLLPTDFVQQFDILCKTLDSVLLTLSTNRSRKAVSCFIHFFVSWQGMRDSMFYVTLWIVYFLLLLPTDFVQRFDILCKTLDSVLLTSSPNRSRKAIWCFIHFFFCELTSIERFHVLCKTLDSVFATSSPNRFCTTIQYFMQDLG